MYQEIDGEDEQTTLIFIIYNCCKYHSKNKKKTPYYQHKLMIPT